MKTSKHTAIGRCKKCNEIVISSAGGIFKQCSCGASFIDQERFSGLYIRLGGEIELIEQICPSTCEYLYKHKENKHFTNTKQLDDYMKKTYNVKWDKKRGEFIIKK